MTIMKGRPAHAPKYMLKFYKKSLKKTRWYWCTTDNELGEALERYGGAGWSVCIYRCRYHKPTRVRWNKHGIAR